MELSIPDKKFLCVDYPGIVKNTDNMLQTLGGEKNVAKTYSESKRLELWFRPRDVGCKPLFGDRQSCTSLVLRVRRRRRKHRQATCDVPIEPSGTSLLSTAGDKPRVDERAVESDEFEYRGEILGIVDTVFRFQSMSDFQFLPMVRQPDGATYSSVCSRVLIRGLHSQSWMDVSSPLYLPPSVFSRMDRPGSYCYRDPPRHRPGYEEHPETKMAPNLIGISRKRRPHFTCIVLFDDKSIPTEPNPGALNKMELQHISTGTIERIKEHFRDQPVWSRSALLARLTPTSTRIEVCAVLPSVAYYYVNGPWRRLWVRLGYDPRRHPESKVYQNLDVRVRHDNKRSDIPIQAKRGVYSYKMPNAAVKSQSQAPVIQQSTFDSTRENLAEEDEDLTTESTSLEATYIFRPGMLPAYRQMIYQLCYIEEPEVQRLVHLNDGEEKQCLEKDGWCLPDTVEKCRSILRSYLRNIDDEETATKGGSVRDRTTTVEEARSSSSSESDRENIGEDEGLDASYEEDENEDETVVDDEDNEDEMEVDFALPNPD